MTPYLVESADNWRYAAAVVALLVLFSITVALWQAGPTLERPWRYVLRAVTFQQFVLAYVAVVRARHTPPGLPEVVDSSLVAIVVSGIVLFVAVVAVIAGARVGDGPRSRHVSA